MKAYIDHLMTYINLDSIMPMKLVVNAGNGSAGPVIDAIEEKFKKTNIPIEFIKINHTPDGSFPNGIPNPMLLENRSSTRDAVIKYKADFGIAWDGDFDRCFLFDEKGSFIEGYYVVGLLAEAFLAKKKCAKIVHDPRLTWNTINVVESKGGIPILCKTGHAFIKEKMRKEDAIYGGEMSGHHYFKDFFYCDSGMIPWLLVVDLINFQKKTLSQLIGGRIEVYPCSGEINFHVDSVQKSLMFIKSYFLNNPSYSLLAKDDTDGLSLEFLDWRFNLRGSNTEPILRLNVESHAKASMVAEKVELIKNILLKNNC